MLTTEERANLIKAARLYYEDNLTQAEVAAQMGVSRPQISKLLSRAREVGIVHIEICAPVEGDAELLKKLKRSFPIEGGIVLPSGTREETVGQCIDYLTAELAYEKFIGIGWGMMLGELVKSMVPLAAKASADAIVFPLIGKVYSANVGYKSNDLVKMLANGSGRKYFQLQAEAFPDSAEARAAIEETDNYLELAHLWRQMDAALLEIKPFPSVPDEGTALRFEDALIRQHAVGSFLSYFFNCRGEFISGAGDFAVHAPKYILSRCRKVIGVGIFSGPRALAGAMRSGHITHVVTTEDVARKVLEQDL